MPHLLIALVTSVVVIGFAIFAKMPTYHTAPVFLVPAIWAIYFLRHKLHLRPVPYALVALAILLHMSGAFGFYQQSPFPISFDIVVHYYFAFAITLVLHAFLSGAYPALTRWQVAVLTFFFMMGLAALHEIMEYSTYLALGEERGMLKPSSSYFFDTSRDLLNNFLGTLTGLGGITLWRFIRKAPDDAGTVQR
jgi:uncharacterized membrane protein YjdF